MSDSFCPVTEVQIVDAISVAKDRVLILAPAIAEPVAQALATAWGRLGRDAVRVILDSDPEVYRLGYGDVAGFEIVSMAAERVGALVCRQPDTRIGLLVVDDMAITFAPVPLLVESESEIGGRLNGFRLPHVPEGLLIELGLGSMGALDQKIGLDPITRTETEVMLDDLKENPPQPFDIARAVRVFTSYLQFVELEVKGCELSRQRISLPKELFSSLDEQTRSRLDSRYQLITPDDEIATGEEQLKRVRKEIEDRYLGTIPGYGKALLVRRNAEFVREVESLKVAQKEFAEQVKVRLQFRIDEAVKDLTEQFLPGVKEHFPQTWNCKLSRYRGSQEEVLRDVLQRAFGRADRYVADMKVTLRFKAVTYECLKDEGFVRHVLNAFPELEKPLEEYDAAPTRD